MMKIDAEREVHGIFDHVERLHVIGESNVAKAGTLLRGCDRLVDRDRGIVGEKPHEPENFPQRLAGAMAGQDRVGDGNRGRIDEGGWRYAALEFELDDGVEGAARRLAADAPP